MTHVRKPNDAAETDAAAEPQSDANAVETNASAGSGLDLDLFDTLIERQREERHAERSVHPMKRKSRGFSMEM